MQFFSGRQKWFAMAMSMSTRQEDLPIFPD